ncbi:redoxin domain-containing protein [Porifericola rhodea]|uniref:redoxin domain-containing protein n=1 Tax=Porifericola rhodea TaxID=930972 RepID=UPI00266692DE|nr:redoxin domain-containing protein [Porifericola rhodea]WKN33522.1 redoxin domain-containing protein [Porifericola rhodea]
MKKLHLLLLFFLALNWCYAQEKKQEPKTLEPGASAPDFSLKGIDGKMHSLSTYADADVLAILFTCNHCPTAQAYEERVIDLVEDYSDKSFQLVAISSNAPNAISLSELGYSDLSDTYEEMQQRAKEMSYNFPYLYDGDAQEAALAYGPVATPHLFVFDKARKLRYVGRLDASEKPGTANAEDARAAIDAVLAGKEVPNPTTKTFGCSIKWAWKDEWVQKQEEAWAQEEVSLEPISADGIRQLIANSSDKLRLINVWATWCGPCVMEFPEFIEIDRMYRGRDFEFISISADKPDKEDKVLSFLRKKEASNQNYLFNMDDKYALIEAIDPNWQGALPYTILVEPGGTIVYSQQGTIDPQEIKKTIVENQYIGRYY